MNPVVVNQADKARKARKGITAIRTLFSQAHKAALRGHFVDACVYLRAMNLAEHEVYGAGVFSGVLSDFPDVEFSGVTPKGFTITFDSYTPYVPYEDFGCDGETPRTVTFTTD